jgi:hypothetical protein
VVRYPRSIKCGVDRNELPKIASLLPMYSKMKLLHRSSSIRVALRGKRITWADERPQGVVQGLNEWFDRVLVAWHVHVPLLLLIVLDSHINNTRAPHQLHIHFTRNDHPDATSAQFHCAISHAMIS